MDQDNNRTIYKLIRQQVRLVLMDRSLPGAEADLVMCDNFNGGYTATQHLISLGHRKIAFLCRQHLNLLPIAERLRGYRQAMQEAGLPALEPVLINATQEITTNYALRSYTEASGEDIRQICHYLDSPHRATALFASNDLIAMQVLRAAEMKCASIPRDLSLVGFDDLDFCSHLTVPLTTIAQDPYQLGFEAARLLLERIEGDTSPARRVILPTHLVVRASTAPPG
jgi:DNA-binding LacI/PurR family transcriptional regulator